MHIDKPLPKRRLPARGGSVYDALRWQIFKRIEKLRYIHRNPVARGLVQEPESWPWSSYRSYAFGKAGAVRISQWSKPKLKITMPATRVPTFTRKGGPARRNNA